MTSHLFTWLCASIGVAVLMLGIAPLGAERHRAGTRMRSAPARDRRARPAAAAITVAVVAILAGGNALVAVGLGLSVYRAALRLAAWRRRRRLRDDSGLSCEVGRALVREIAMGCSTGEAVVRAADSLPPGRAKWWLGGAAQLVRLGETAENALLSRVAGLPSVEHVARITSAPLPAGARSEFLAQAVEGIEADAKARAEVIGNLTEPRFVAVAIPVLGVVLALLLAAFEPAVVTVTDSPFGIAVCLICVMVCAAGAAVVLRLTQV